MLKIPSIGAANRCRINNDLLSLAGTISLYVRTRPSVRIMYDTESFQIVLDLNQCTN